MAVFVFKQQVLFNLKRFEKDLVINTIFRQKPIFGISSRKSFPNNFQLFLAFINILDRFSVFVHFDRFERFTASFQYFEGFWTSLVKKNFFVELFFSLPGNDKIFKRLKLSFSFFLLFDRFLISVLPGSYLFFLNKFLMI